MQNFSLHKKMTPFFYQALGVGTTTPEIKVYCSNINMRILENTFLSSKLDSWFY